MTKLQHLMQRGTDFLGCDVAIMCGAMSWVSERNLVSAISNAGGFGVIACGAMTPELLDTEIAATKALTTKPFGVNLITMHPQIMDLIAADTKANLTDRPGGIFVRSSEHMPAEDRALFQAVARIVITDTEGTLRSQASRQWSRQARTMPAPLLRAPGWMPAVPVPVVP